MSAPFKFILVALALLVGTTGLALLHLENRRLERRLAAAAPRTREAARLREDNARLERLIAEQRRSADSARALVRRDIEKLRAQIAMHEQKADQQRSDQLAVTTRDAAALENNRDPRLGPTRLEHFQNRGQATPSAAFETLVWAALKGDDATLANVTTLNSATRAQAEAFIAQLPANARANWTPEKLGRLWFTGLFTEMSAAQIVGETIGESDEATVRLRLANRGDEEKLAVRLTPDGWKVLVPSAAVDHLKKKLLPSR
jgi:hypothetical protein